VTDKRLQQRVRSAIARCTNEHHPDWRAYGGRGIRVCQQWLEDPAAFAVYLASLPGALDDGLHLDRIDNSRGYEPGNLRFATLSQSNSNRRAWVQRPASLQRLAAIRFARENCVRLKALRLSHGVCEMGLLPHSYCCHVRKLESGRGNQLPPRKLIALLYAYAQLSPELAAELASVLEG
jgi:hypothetical protein